MDVEDDGVVSRMMLATDDLLRPAPLPLSPSSSPELLASGAFDTDKRFEGWMVLSTKPTEVGEWLISCHVVPPRMQVPWVDPEKLRRNEAWREARAWLRSFSYEHRLLKALYLKSPLTKLVAQLDEKYADHICRDCKSWDRKEGLEEYTRITHRFEGGEVGQLNKDVARLVSAELNIANIDETKIGFCARFDRLIQGDFPACPSFERRFR